MLEKSVLYSNRISIKMSYFLKFGRAFIIKWYKDFEQLSIKMVGIYIRNTSACTWESLLCMYIVPTPMTIICSLIFIAVRISVGPSFHRYILQNALTAHSIFEHLLSPPYIYLLVMRPAKGWRNRLNTFTSAHC